MLAPRMAVPGAMICAVGLQRKQNRSLDCAYVRPAGRTRRVEIRAVPPCPERGQGLAKLASVAWWVDLILGGLEWRGEGIRDSGSRQTRVVVRYHGREHLLFEESPFDVAKGKCERVAQEYESMDCGDWCRRYRVPEQFFAD
jgi:hypothetical protein